MADKSGFERYDLQNLDVNAEDKADSSTEKSDSEFSCGVHKSVLEFMNNVLWNNTVDNEEWLNCEEWFIPPDDLTSLHSIDLVESKLVPFPTKEYKIPPMPENDATRSNFRYLPGLDTTHQVWRPKYSCLSRKEQYQLYSFYCRMMYKNRSLSEQEVSKFQELRAKASGECAEFQEFAKTRWLKGEWKRVLQIPQEVELFINNFWSTKANQCVTIYPNEYKTAVPALPLTLTDPNKDHSVMSLLKQVHTESLPPKMTVPKLRQPCVLVSGYEELCQIKPIAVENSKPRSIVKEILPASLDPVMNMLLERPDLDVDVAITMSGIKTLMDNIKFQHDWVVPVTVKSILKSDGETVKKVVIIDKKIPPQSMSVHDKNIWHAKIVSKWMLILNEYPELFNTKEDVNLQNMAKEERELISYDDILSDVAELMKLPRKKTEQSLFSKKNSESKRTKERELMSYDDILTDDVEPPKPPNNKMKQATKKSETTVNNEKRTVMKRADISPLTKKIESKSKSEEQKRVSYNESLIDNTAGDFEEFGIDAGRKQNKTKNWQKEMEPAPKTGGERSLMNETPETRKWLGCKPKIPSNNTQDNTRRKIIIEDKWKKNGSEYNSSLKMTANRSQIFKPCVTYNLWKLEKSKQSQLLKCEQRSLNLLVRTRIDGRLFHYKNHVKLLEDVSVSSKLEFQPEHGASKMSPSELMREYIDLYMRPNSKLVRVRSLGHTKEIMLVEKKSLVELREALQAENHQVIRLFDPLYAVLTKLVNLSPGRYLLRHTAKMGPFATLLQAEAGWNMFSLENHCHELQPVEVHVPPVPIDPIILTALHHREKLAPALFYPANPNFKSRPPPGRHSFPKPPDMKGPVKKKKKRVRKKRAKMNVNL